MARLNSSDPRLETIRALLAKAEATTYPAEAEAFTAKASELMARYSIDEAMVWATSPGDSSTPEEIRVELLRPFVAQKAVLVHRVANAFGCQAVRLGRGSTEHGEVQSIVGFPSDLEMVETLVTSLLLQLTSAMTAPGAQPAGRSASQVAAWRRSFIFGFTTTIADRLARDRAAAQAERDRHAATGASNPGPSANDSRSSTPRPDTSAASVAVVLADRAASVKDEFRVRFPNVRSAPVSAGTSSDGHRAGNAAGRRADLGGRRLSNRGALDRAG